MDWLLSKICACSWWCLIDWRLWKLCLVVGLKTICCSFFIYIDSFNKTFGFMDYKNVIWASKILSWRTSWNSNWKDQQLLLVDNSENIDRWHIFGRSTRMCWETFSSVRLWLLMSIGLSQGSSREAYLQLHMQTTKYFQASQVKLSICKEASSVLWKNSTWCPVSNAKKKRTLILMLGRTKLIKRNRNISIKTIKEVHLKFCKNWSCMDKVRLVYLFVIHRDGDN